MHVFLHSPLAFYSCMQFHSFCHCMPFPLLLSSISFLLKEISFMDQATHILMETEMEKKVLLPTISIVFSIIFFVSPVSSHNVPAIFTFGDSIFDAGNNHFNKNCTVQADFPPYGQNYFRHPTGRFTNGRTVADFISQFLGLDLQKPYLEVEMEIINGTTKYYPLNGMNFASAGSGVLNETNKNMGVTSIQDQLRQFQNLVKQDKIDKKIVQQALFLLESGSNDVFNYFIPLGTPKLDDPKTFVNAMLVQVEQFITQIYNMGARRIAVFSLGPVGCIPARVNLPGAPINKCYGKMNVMVKMYNEGLESLVSGMPVKYPGVAAVYGSVYNIVHLFRAAPKRYGFSNISSACCGEGTVGGLMQCGTSGAYKVCEKPNEFLFWDWFHPTEHAYKLISKALWAGKTSRIKPLNLQTLANITLKK